MRIHSSMTDLKVLIRGAGEQASGIAHRLYKSHFRVALTEVEAPLAVRRKVAFSEAVWDGAQEVEGITARRVSSPGQFDEVLDKGAIPVIVDPSLSSVEEWEPHVVIDATIAKRNLGTSRDMAQLVIGFGPGFTAGVDVDVVVETNRGHDMGRLIFEGSAEPNTGIPGDTGGYTVERVVRAPKEGIFFVSADIGTLVKKGDLVASVEDVPVYAAIDGVVRGMLRPGIRVWPGLKAGDIDPRNDVGRCFTISEKARALGGAALEAILWRFNQ